MAEYTFADNPFLIGYSAPDFNLKGVDGEMHSLATYADKPILVVMAICNHCPYVQAYLERLVALQEKFMDKGVQFVGINSNDVSRYPTDGFEDMVKTAEEYGFNFPYLRDDDQSVAEAYHAERTPQIFVFDAERKLQYTGGIDNNYQNPDAVTERPLEDALNALVEGRDV
ncbi:MAG: thioredoxin family protein, partial [Candidatus Peregrinibacteria bacterium]|nr:thioredoxin family protein [Candidatus Peregrinibacteria bacterium]